nr:hypothetical protein [uncultured Arsenicibacter sp.]
MRIEHIREQIHQLVDEIDDIYVLNGLYRNLMAEKRQKEEYERDQAKSSEKAKGRRMRDA